MPVPVAGPEEIVAEVDSAWICGTDLHIYLDEFETAPPVTLGHEFAGLTGPGPIGLLALQLAKAAGASVALLGIEADRARLELARQPDADHTLEINGVTDVQAAVQDLFHAEGIDLVIECSGAGPAAETLLNLVRRGGRFCQMGLFGKPISWNQDLVCYKEVSVTGTNAHVPSAWSHALKFMAERRARLRPNRAARVIRALRWTPLWLYR